MRQRELWFLTFSRRCWPTRLRLTSVVADVAKSVSPRTFVRVTVPPVLSVHGDADSAVPYSQSVRLHQALKNAGVVEYFPFTRAQYEKIFTAIDAFLTQLGIKAKQ
jgi:pimeloyl-ACP methyl ester carboxylesterase